MCPPIRTNTHQSGSAVSSAAAGTWRLHAGRAVTLRPTREAGELRVASGWLWATLDGPHGRAPWDSGDLVLRAGDRLRLAAGQRVVIENGDAAAPARFAWDALAAADNRSQPARARPHVIATPPAPWPAPNRSNTRSVATKFSTWLRSALPSAATLRRA